jgi:hypothetical protein
VGLTIPTDGFLTLALPWRGFFFTPALWSAFPPIKPLVHYAPLRSLGRYGAGVLVLGAMTSMTSPVRGSIRLHGDAGPCEPIIWRSRSARIRLR